MTLGRSSSPLAVEPKTLSAPETAGVPPASIRSRARSAIAGDGLFGRFAYLLATQAVLIGTGLAYWTLTARLVAARDVGVAAAAVSLATLFSAIGVLGIGSLLLVEVRHVETAEIRAVISTGVAIASVAVGALCVASLGISHWLGPSMAVIGVDPLLAGLYVFGAMVLTAGIVLDAAAIGLRRGPAQFARNSFQAVLRLLIVAVAVALLHARTPATLLIAWVASITASLFVAPPLLGLPPPAPIGLYGRLAIIQRLGAVALRHHVLNLAISSVTFFLPAIAALIVDSRSFAYFSVAQLISSAALLPPALLAMTLFAETTGDEALLRESIKRTVPVGFVCCLVVLAVIEPLAPNVLGLFGSQYAEHSVTVLRLLVLGGLGYIVKDHYVSIRRAQRRLTQAARVVACSTVGEVAGAAIGGATFGLTGLCAGWVIATVLEGFCFAPVVMRLLFTSDAAGRSPT